MFVCHTYDREHTCGRSADVAPTNLAPITEIRLVALEDESRHGKLVSLYRSCGFETSGKERFESDSQYCYRLVPMAKLLVAGGDA